MVSERIILVNELKNERISWKNQMLRPNSPTYTMP